LIVIKCQLKSLGSKSLELIDFTFGTTPIQRHWMRCQTLFKQGDLLSNRVTMMNQSILSVCAQKHIATERKWIGSARFRLDELFTTDSKLTSSMHALGCDE